MIHVHLIHKSERYSVACAPGCELGMLRAEAARHFVLPSWNVVLEYRSRGGAVWTVAPGRSPIEVPGTGVVDRPTTIGTLLRRQGPLRMESPAGQLLAAAPRTAIELRINERCALALTHDYYVPQLARAAVRDAIHGRDAWTIVPVAGNPN